MSKNPPYRIRTEFDKKEQFCLAYYVDDKKLMAYYDLVIDTLCLYGGDIVDWNVPHGMRMTASEVKEAIFRLTEYLSERFLHPTKITVVEARHEDHCFVFDYNDIEHTDHKTDITKLNLPKEFAWYGKGNRIRREYYLVYKPSLVWVKGLMKGADTKCQWRNFEDVVFYKLWRILERKIKVRKRQANRSQGQKRHNHP